MCEVRKLGRTRLKYVNKNDFSFQRVFKDMPEMLCVYRIFRLKRTIEEFRELKSFIDTEIIQLLMDKEFGKSLINVTIPKTIIKTNSNNYNILNVECHINFRNILDLEKQIDYIRDFFTQLNNNIINF